MKNFISVTLIAAIAITVLVFTACTKKGETQQQTAADNPYPQILAGDLSDFAGTWVNGYGNRIQLHSNGTLGEGKVNWINLNDSGVYVWGIQYDAETSGVNVRLYPVGIYVISEDSQVIQSDSRTVRITTEDMLYSMDEIYYREGAETETTNPHPEILADVLSAFAGTWVNNAGNKIELKTNSTYVMHQSGSSWENEITGGFKIVYQTYGDYFHWGHPAGDFGIYLVPVDVDFILNGKVFRTDNSKIRLITEDLHSDPVVYYRDESTETVTHPIINISDKLNGETINVTIHCSPVIRNSDDQIIGYSIDRLIFFYDGKEHSLFMQVDREDEPVYFTGLGMNREFSITTAYDYNSDGHNDIGVHNIDPFSETYREMHGHFLYDPRAKNFHRDNTVRCSFYAQ